MRYRRTGNYSDKRFKLNCVLEDEMVDDSEDYEDNESAKIQAQFHAKTKILEE